MIHKNDSTHRCNDPACCPPPVPLEAKVMCYECSIPHEIETEEVGTTGRPQGRKDDAGKPDPTLLPWDGLAPVVRVLTKGAEKYGRENWRAVPGARRRYSAAALRHILAWCTGETADHDTGESHLAHAACCLLFLLALGHGGTKTP